MAARRLVIAMVVLLTVSTAIAILAPQREVKSGGDAGSGTTGATGTALTSGESGPTGESPGLKAGEEEVTDSGGEIITATVTGKKPRSGTIDMSGVVQSGMEVAVKEGDRLILDVDLGKPARIAIPGMGLTGNTTASTPATFDMLIQGEFPQKVVDVDSGEVIATIVTSMGKKS